MEKNLRILMENPPKSNLETIVIRYLQFYSSLVHFRCLHKYKAVRFSKETRLIEFKMAYLP
jgi:hypothetical protein